MLSSSPSRPSNLESPTANSAARCFFWTDPNTSLFFIETTSLSPFRRFDLYFWILIIDCYLIGCRSSLLIEGTNMAYFRVYCRGESILPLGFFTSIFYKLYVLLPILISKLFASPSLSWFDPLSVFFGWIMILDYP